MTIILPILMLVIILLGLIAALVLFRKNTIPTILDGDETLSNTISVIIPARNEEVNLPKLLESLLGQSIKPDEIIVVDDHSEDRTKIVGESYGVKVLSAPDLPEGWTGKNWALWHGYLQSTGDLLVFLDADVRLAPHALKSLILEQRKQGGVISTVPYHKAEKFYEKFAMVLNILGVFAFTSPFERENPKKGLYGACIVATRDHYEKIGGHRNIRAEMLDDLNLGAEFQRVGIPVINYIGGKLIAFRMYPNGIKGELEGFSKGTILSTASIHVSTITFIVLWILGLIVSLLSFAFIGTPYFPLLLVGYILYAVEFLYLNRNVGSFGIIHPLFYFLSTIFFLVVVGHSLYQAIFLKKVVWKGRYIRVGKGGKS